ncbi:MAG: putative inorganic carbon transporter subunit DabA, partial [Myxococcota bacterium]
MATTALQTQIEEAAEPVSQFWPMKGFVSHNPLQGLEHLPFDEAFQQAKHLFGAEGYLPLHEYRELHQAGRISARSIDQALARLVADSGESVSLASRTIAAAEVRRAHLLHGIDPLEPALFDWQVTSCDALSVARAGAPATADVGGLWQAALSVLGLVDPSAGSSEPEDLDAGDDAAHGTAAAELPFRRALSDWIDATTGASVVAQIDSQVIKWVSSFVDEGMAGWEMPSKRDGFYAAWRELAQHDASGRLLGIGRFAEKVAALPDDAEAAVRASLEALEIPEARWPDYLARVLGQLPGWTGLVRWRALNPEDPIQKSNPIDVVQYLAVRLFYEVELVVVEAGRQWAVAGTLPAIASEVAARAGSESPHAHVGANKRSVCRDAWRLFHLGQLLDLSADDLRAMPRADAQTVLGWLDAFHAEEHNPVWLEAYEDSFRHTLLSKIAEHRASGPEVDGRPLAQAAFCIDVRSEPFRRHFEDTGAFETFGYAGFFGIPIDHRNFDTEESFPLCPVLLTPSNALLELPRAGQEEALESYASGSRWKRFGEHLLHDLKHNPVAAFLLVDVLGPFFSAALLGKTLFRRPWDALVRTVRGWFATPVVTEIPVASATDDGPHVGGLPVELARGFSIEQQASFVEGGL